MKKKIVSILEIIFPELKYWEFYWKYNSINWRDLNSLSARACQAAHWSWGRRLLWSIGIGLQLKKYK